VAREIAKLAATGSARNHLTIPDARISAAILRKAAFNTPGIQQRCGDAAVAAAEPEGEPESMDTARPLEAPNEFPVIRWQRPFLWRERVKRYALESARYPMNG
jgi:hypothetical protein